VRGQGLAHSRERRAAGSGHRDFLVHAAQEVRLALRCASDHAGVRTQRDPVTRREIEFRRGRLARWRVVDAGRGEEVRRKRFTVQNLAETGENGRHVAGVRHLEKRHLVIDRSLVDEIDVDDSRSHGRGTRRSCNPGR